MFAVNWHMCDWMQGVTNKFELGFVDSAWHRKYVNNIITTLIFCKFADLYRPSCLLVVSVFCLTVCLLVLVWTLTFVSHCSCLSHFVFHWLLFLPSWWINTHIYIYIYTQPCTHNHFTAPFWDYPCKSVPEEIFLWTLWCKGRWQRQTHWPSGWAPLHPD